MNPHAMKPFGRALQNYFEGGTNTELIICRDDGDETPVPVSLFFREAHQFTAIEKTAIEHCHGHILDVGGGSGLHSLILKEKGYHLTTIDISPEAVSIMKKRGLKNVHCADIFQFSGGPFDTLLLLGHGIGLVETIQGLHQFLAKAHSLLSVNGQIILDSLDVRASNDPKNLAYQESNHKAKRYIGEIRMQFKFKGQKGPYFGWLHVDADTLKKHAKTMNWNYEIIQQEQTGDYLARLSKQTD